jgi:hypothetical protein
MLNNWTLILNYILLRSYTGDDNLEPVSFGLFRNLDNMNTTATEAKVNMK